MKDFLFWFFAIGLILLFTNRGFQCSAGFKKRKIHGAFQYEYVKNKFVFCFLNSRYHGSNCVINTNKIDF